MKRMDKKPHDARLPYLSIALDTAAMQIVFATALFQEELCQEELFRKEEFSAMTKRSGGHYQITSYTIERIKYKPGQHCLIYYVLQIQDTLVGETIEQIICARTYPPDDALAHFAKAQTLPLVCTRFGKAVLYLPALAMVAWLFPNDRKLTSLPKLMDQQWLQNEHLPALIEASVGPHWQIRGLASQIIHYAPEQTCTIRVHLNLQQPAMHEQQTMILFGKTYANEDGATTYKVMQDLWDENRRNNQTLTLAQPLAYAAPLKILWQQGLPGQTLADVAYTSPHFLTLLERAACAVAMLHRTRSVCHRVSSLVHGGGNSPMMRTA